MPLSFRPGWMESAVILMLLWSGSRLSLVRSDPQHQSEIEAVDDINEEDASRHGLRMGSLVSPYRPPTSCELTQQCCGMVNQQCCQNGGEKCYTVWERKCQSEDNPQCRVRLERHCKTINVKDCRIVSEVTYRDFVGTVCLPKPMTKCFRYESKVCVPASRPASQEIHWRNEKLHKVEEEIHQHCLDVKTYECEKVTEPETVQQKVRKEEKIQDTRNVCRMVPKVQDGQEVVVPVTRIVYQEVCYDMPVQSCSKMPCSDGRCNPMQSACSLNNFNTNTICPYPGSSGGAFNSRPPLQPTQNCEQVRLSACDGASGGACQAGIQQCCSQRTQKVCRRVPKRITDQVTQTRPGRTTWERECQEVPYERTVYRYETEEVVINRTRQECDPVVNNVCHNYTIPTYSVVDEEKFDTVQIQVPACQPQVKEATYCHNFPTGEVECRNQTLKRGFRINKIKCDRMVDRPICFNIPVADCRLGTNANCVMVPRQVCQTTCNSSSQCMTCDTFRRENGFGSCPTSTCPNFFPGDLTVSGPYDSQRPGAAGGEAIIPLPGAEGGYFPGQQIPGSEGGYFPGQQIPGSGGGYFPGQQIPGSEGGYFPGQQIPGSEGGYFPGQQIPGSGGGYFPGQGTGSEGGYFPGQQIPGSEGGYFPGQQIPGSEGGYFPGQQIPGSEGGYFPGQQIPGSDGGYFPGQQIPGSEGGYFPGQLIPGSEGGYFPGQQNPGSGGGYFPGQLPGSGGGYFEGLQPTASLTTIGDPGKMQKESIQLKSPYDPPAAEYQKLTQLEEQKPTTANHQEGEKEEAL